MYHVAKNKDLEVYWSGVVFDELETKNRVPRIHSDEREWEKESSEEKRGELEEMKRKLEENRKAAESEMKLRQAVYYKKQEICWWDWTQRR